MSTYEFLPKAQLQPIHQLPDPFLKPDGTRVASPAEWPEQREYLKAMLAHYMYGTMPPPPGNTRGEVIFSRPVYNGRAVAETVRITCGPNDAVQFNCDLIRPAKEGKVPVITWNQFTDRHGSPDEENVVLGHGYAVIEFDKEQVVPDNANAIHNPLADAYPGYTWGAIAMWAWMQSRVVDYLETTDFADMDKIVATGHSRGGKVAICAAIYDERFAVCAPNDSGCGGCGCFRYLGGRLGEGTGLCETAGSVEDAFPFWWCDNFGEFGNRAATYTRSNAPLMKDMQDFANTLRQAPLGKTADEDYMPFDLHFVRACVAPRAFISCEALADTWANPFGTQITWRAAEEVYRFLGAEGKNAQVMRDGPHQFQAVDWQHIVSFCDAMFYGKPMNGNIQCFTPPDPDDVTASMAKMMPAMDWRNECLHFDWRAPVQE